MTSRRATREVRAGSLGIGGANPIRIQSMTTAAPDDVAGTVAECERLAAAGCELTRISTPKVTDAALLADVKRALAARGVMTPLAADIHFVPAAALEAARHVEKVRINPGNYADHKAGRARDYTDEAYRAEVVRIGAACAPLLERLKARRVALRIGVNHGSLSDRIMSRFGDTPEGMVESALEYARRARAENFHDIVLSMKASNPRVMIRAYRLLWDAMRREDMDYPTHLGVTEAGEGEDGRLRSAIGIGALLADGIGDTIRVSLAEPPENEIPVARELAGLFADADADGEVPTAPWRRRPTRREGIVGGDAPVRIAGDYGLLDVGGEIPCEIDTNAMDHVADLDENDDLRAVPEARIYRLLIRTPARALAFARRAAARLGDAPLLLSYRHDGPGLDLAAAVALGTPLVDGFGDAIEIASDAPPAKRHALALAILQNSMARISRVQIIACPTCGRTLYALTDVLPEIKRRFAHLQGVKIAVMGCIVNGPGEMADADYGFVGGAPGRINLYRGRDCVEKGIPISEAYDRLERLIAQDRR